jgi:outer membrane protein with beta-barrel domain
MKKVVLILLVVTGLAKVTNAQKGSWLVYGNLNVAANTDSFAFKSNSYAINPGIGYQLNDNWTAGLNFAFGGTKSETALNPTTPSGNYNTTSFFNVGPFLRYSYSINKIFSIYAQTDLNYLSGSSNPYNLVSGSYTGFGADLFPAIAVNIKNGFAINLSFGGISYQTKTYTGGAYNTTGSGNLSTANQFAFTFGQGATFGISKNFGGGKEKK